MLSSAVFKQADHGRERAGVLAAVPRACYRMTKHTYSNAEPMKDVLPAIHTVFPRGMIRRGPHERAAESRSQKISSRITGVSLKRYSATSGFYGRLTVPLFVYR